MKQNLYFFLLVILLVNLKTTVYSQICPRVTLSKDTIKVCRMNSYAYVTVNISTVARGKWSHSGTGKLYPKDTSVSYYVSYADNQARKPINVSYTVEATTTCPVASDTVVVIPVADPTITFSENNPYVCEGDSVTLEPLVVGASPFIYEWVVENVKSPVTIGKLTVSGSSKPTGKSIIFYVTDVNKCYNKDQVIVRQVPRPNINIGTDRVVNNKLISLKADTSKSKTITWNTSGSGMFSQPSSVATDYTLSDEDANNGIINISASAGNGYCFEKQEISIAYIPENSISGSVYAGADRLDAGVANLFKYSDGKYQSVYRSIVPDISGTDYNVKADSGRYLIMVSPLPKSKFFNSYLPTYYIKSTQWNTAELLNANFQNLLEKDIHLVQFTSADPLWNTGNETITGSVYYTSNPNQRVEANDKNLLSGIIYLMNSAGAKITYTLIDNDGIYTFNNVKAGDYKLIVEYAGVQTQQPVVIVADNDPLTSKSIDLAVNENIVTAVWNSAVTANSLTIAPVPATRILNVSIPQSEEMIDSKITIFNYHGIPVYEDPAIADHVISINIEGLEKGVYLLRWENSGRSLAQKFIKE